MQAINQGHQKLKMSFVKWCELCQAEGIRSPVCLFQINFTEAVQMCKRPECLDLVQAKSFQSLIVHRDVLQPGQKIPVPETNTLDTTFTKPKITDNSSVPVDDSLERFLASFDDDPAIQHTSKDCNNPAIISPATLLPEDKETAALSEVTRVPVVSAKEAAKTTLAKGSSAELSNVKEETPLNGSQETVRGVTNASRGVRTNSCNTLARELEEHSYTKPPQLESAQNTSRSVESNASPQVPMIPSSEGKEQGSVSVPDIYASGVPSICDGFYPMDVNAVPSSSSSQRCRQDRRNDIIFDFTERETSRERDTQHRAGFGNAGSFYSAGDTVSSCLRIAESMGSVTVVRSLESACEAQDPLVMNDHFIMELGASVDVTHQSVYESKAPLTVELMPAQNPSIEVLKDTGTNSEPPTSYRVMISEATSTIGSYSMGQSFDVDLPERCSQGRGSKNFVTAVPAVGQQKGTRRTAKQANPADDGKNGVRTHVTQSVRPTSQLGITGASPSQSKTEVDRLQSAASSGQTKTIIEYHTPEGFHYYKAVPAEDSAESSTNPGSRTAPKRKLPEESPTQQPPKPRQARVASTRNAPLVLNKLAMISSVLQNSKKPPPGSFAPLPHTQKSRPPKKKARKMEQRAPQRKHAEQQLPAYRVSDPGFSVDLSLSQRSPVRSEDGSSSSKQSSGSDGMQGSRFSLLGDSSLGANVSSSTFVRMVKDQVRARTQSGSGFAGYHPVLANKPPYGVESKTGRQGRKNVLPDSSFNNLSQELDEIVTKVEKTDDGRQYDSILAELLNIV
ncbi:uncharacterized protein LOC135393866 [Ornithodoros turicata]|uniref:uncharacterized protein LOC135393866 n=1 Tax=Ornithodoros turicata TaxID=34597 RepID=UPI0031387958